MRMTIVNYSLYGYRLSSLVALGTARRPNYTADATNAGAGSPNAQIEWTSMLGASPYRQPILGGNRTSWQHRSIAHHDRPFISDGGRLVVRSVRRFAWAIDRRHDRWPGDAVSLGAGVQRH